MSEYPNRKPELDNSRIDNWVIEFFLFSEEATKFTKDELTENLRPMSNYLKGRVNWFWIRMQPDETVSVAFGRNSVTMQEAVTSGYADLMSATEMLDTVYTVKRTNIMTAARISEKVWQGERVDVSSTVSELASDIDRLREMTEPGDLLG